MKTSTFNVNEFNTIYSMIEDNSNKISTKSNEITSLCEQLAQLIKSTDSDLSSAYLKIGEALSIAKVKVLDLLVQLENEMKVYAKSTVANEEEVENKLNEINTNIEEIANIFNNIAGNNG